MSVKAVILAGGKGTRLRPLTYAVPKPLLPIGQRPILEHILLQLKKNGIRDFVFTISYLGYQIRNFFGDGSDWGVSISYSEERKPLGNAGCLLPIKHHLKGTFILMAGDNLTTLNFKKFLSFHRRKGGIATLALAPIEVPVHLGIAQLDKRSRIVGFAEKPKYRFNAATLIWALEPRILKYLPKGFSDINKDILPKLLKAGEKVYGYPMKEFWLDIGSMEDYKKLNHHD